MTGEPEDISKVGASNCCAGLRSQGSAQCVTNAFGASWDADAYLKRLECRVRVGREGAKAGDAHPHFHDGNQLHASTWFAGGSEAS